MQDAYKQSVDDFLKQKAIAVVGFSSHTAQPANHIYKRLADNDYTVYAVNNKASLIGDVKCYKELSEINTPIDGVVLCTPPLSAPEIIKQCIQLNIKHVWMHRSLDQGSYHAAAKDMCLGNGINCITYGCPLMFIEADVAHKCIKWFLSLRGKLKI